MGFRSRHRLTGAGLFVLVLASGCDPTLNLWGSMFPAWVVCLLIAVTLAVLVRWGLAVAGLERHLGPLVLVYPSLVVLLSCLTWAVLFRG